MNPIFCKFSNDRSPEFQIKTIVSKKSDGEKVVYKLPLCDEAKGHVENIYSVYCRLKDSYAGTIFEPNRCEKNDNGVEFEFISDKTLEEVLDELYEKKEYLEIIDKIKEFKEILYSLKDNVSFCRTEEYEKVFGKNASIEEDKALAVSNIDMVFGNIMLGEKWTVIDYEWTFDFPIPIEYILYRAIYYYVHGSTKREELTKLNVFKLLGISDEKINIYAQMEYHFQKYVAGEKATIPQLKGTMLQKQMNIANSHILDNDEYVQIYFDYGDGYSEENSIKHYYNFFDEKVVFDFVCDKKVICARIHPAKQKLIINNNLVKVNNTEHGIVDTTGIKLAETAYLFDTDYPWYTIENIEEKSEIHIEFNVCKVTDDVIDALHKTKLGYEEKINQKQQIIEQHQQTVEEQQQVIGQQQQMITDVSQMVEAEKNTITALEQNIYDKDRYIAKIHSVPGFRFARLGYKTLKGIKNDGFVHTGKRVVRKIKNKLKPGSVAPVIANISESTNGKNILFVVHEAQNAGGTLLSISMIETLKKYYGYNPIIILEKGGPLVDKIKTLGKCYELNQEDFKMVYNRVYLKEIIDEVVNMGVEYAICNCVVSGLCLEEIKKHNIKTLTLIHELSTSIKVYDFVKSAEYVQKYSDDIVFAAEYVKNDFIANFPVDESKCHVLPQGVFSKYPSIRYEEKESNKIKLCQELNIPENSKIVLGCGYGNFRKGLDWFGQVGVMSMVEDENIHFVWLGERDSEFFGWINNDIAKNNLNGRFHWIGFTENPGYIFAASDAFLLSSREDPFPSVVLDAMKQCSTVVAFENSGGIPEILVDGKGVVVPYGDCKVCAEKIVGLLKDEEQRKQIATVAQKYVKKLTPRNYIGQILKIMSGQDIQQKTSDLKVSVIIPNYNYERYIPERLESICNQSVLPYEIIFLDDVSKDNSVEVAREILEDCGIKHKIIANKTNKGCFKQWAKGINEAEGDIIWIAEADDLCEYNFLEKLLPFFEDDQVNLAYGQSEVIYEEGQHSGFVYTEYTNDLDPNKWLNDYVNDGQSEIIDGLGIKNTIPNASGTLMRKTALKGLDEKIQEYDISGDWFAYVYAIQVGKMAFCSDVLNYHRRHSSSIIHKREQDIKLFVELMKIKNFIADTFLIPESIKDRFINHVKNEYQRLSSEKMKAFDSYEELSSLQSSLEQKVNDNINKYNFLGNGTKKNLMFVIPDFEMGGGQTLVVRLANYFSKFHNVYLYNARPWLVEERIVKMVSRRVNILDSNGTPEQLREYVIGLKIDTINNHIWWSDKIVYKAANDLDVKIVLSMHGCYEALMQNPDWDEEFQELAPKILNRANSIIYATDKNKKIFETVDVDEKINQIYYGYELESIPNKIKASLDIDEDAYIFGLVARGIKEKGFGEAVEAFKSLKEKTQKKIELVLIGNGSYIDELKKKNAKQEKIHFVDNLKKPSEWIGWVKCFDCALLPTYFISESLPNSVIEYLAYGVPVISTDIGDIKYMLKNDKAEAGILLALKDGIVDYKDLCDAMQIMLEDESKYQEYQTGAKILFEQFDMKNFAKNYYSLY